MIRIGLGMMRIGNMSSNEVEELMDRCIEEGITFFDLADIYGGTKCESLVGEVLSRRQDIREKIYLQTKVGISKDTRGYDSSYDYIVSKTKECLKRLNTSYVDSLLIHRPDVLMDAEEVAKAIKFLQENKMIKDFGVSNFTKSEIEYLETELETPIKYNQVQLGLGNTTMIDQTMLCNVPSSMVSKEADSLLFFLKKEKIAIQCWSPFQFGFFKGSIFDETKFPEINNALNKYAEKYHATKCAIATAWLLKIDKNLIVITGSTNINHIKESIDALNINLSKEDWYRIYEECGHLLP